MPQLNNFHFTLSERKLYLRILDIIFVIASLYVFSLFYNFQYFDFSNNKVINWLLLLVFYLLFFGEIFEMYNLKVASDFYLSLKSTIITVVFVSLFYIFTPILSPILPQNRLQLVYFSLMVLLGLSINRFIYIYFIFSPRFFKNILIIGEKDEIEHIINFNHNKEVNNIGTYVSNEAIDDNDSLCYVNCEDVDLEGLIKDKYINEVIVSSNNTTVLNENINKQLISLFEKGVSIKSVDSFIENELFVITKNQLNSTFYNFFTFSKNHQNKLYLVSNRLFDILFSLIGIALLLVCIPFVFIINLIGNKGNLFYKQKRVGKRGKEFTIIKFRSMVMNAEEKGVVWAQKNDVRITPFGKFLRKSRLDEMPQFINILKGEMSLIGPRPERPEFVNQLKNDIPFYAIRHVIKPGLTGWAQVMHPYASTTEDQEKKLMYDLYYIKERDTLLDLKITIKTISTVLFFRGN